jgi:hypothetical protein
VSQTFLGFEQQQGASGLDYTYTDEYCGYHAWRYKIFKGNELVFTKDCPNDYESYYVYDLLFTSESTGFLVQGFSHVGNADATILRTDDHGNSWTYFNAPDGVPGPDDNCAIFVLSDLDAFFVSISYPGGPFPNYIMMNDFTGPIGNDTIINYASIGPNQYNIDTLSFNVLHNGDTINYKIAISYLPQSIHQKINPDITIYPIPSNDFIQIKTNNHLQNRFTLNNIQGNVLKEYHFKNEIQIDIRDLRQGLYIINIENQSSSFSEKIVKY